MNKKKPVQSDLLGDEALPPGSGKDEMNFAEFPIALLSDRVPRGQTTIRFEDEFYDEKRKKMIKRRRLIEGSQEYGLPTATDDLVILALIQLTKLKGNFDRREVEFTRLELITLLGWANEGKNYDRIKLSLLRIANVTYNFDNAWWDGRLKSWTTRAFHILDTVEINDSRQDGQAQSRIVWNDVVFESFQVGYLRDLDYRFCVQLHHPIALRMYRFLGKRFYHRPDWTFDLKEFALEHMGLGQGYEGGTQIARKLQPAIHELERAGFLEVLTEAERYPQRGRGWTIRLVQGRVEAPAVVALAEPTQVEVIPSPLVESLVSRGVTRSKAEDLVGEVPADRITAKIEVFDWLVQAHDRRVSKSPAGYLVASILEDYAMPRGFPSRAESRCFAPPQPTPEPAVESQRRERLEANRRGKLQSQAIDAYWKSLTTEQQVALDAAADALADPESLSREVGPLKRLGRRVRRGEYIQRLLEDAPRDDFTLRA